MSLVFAPPPVETAPGVEVTSQDGTLTAIVHAGFPGVLLRVMALGVTEAEVWRTDGGEWVRVRSGSPLIVSSGLGFAYDSEVAPGGSYMFTVDRGDAASAVIVRLPGWSGVDESAGWLVSARDPHLSRLCLMGRPRRRARNLTAQMTAIPGALSVGTDYGVGADEWEVEVFARSVRERDLLDALLTSGPLLWHPHPMMESPLAHQWLHPRTLEWDQRGGPGGGWVHSASVGVTQSARPATTVSDPLRVPGWGWYESTAGLTTAAAYAATYPTTWDQLKAGVQGWSR